MANRLLKKPSLRYTPGTPTVLGSPAYSYWELRAVPDVEGIEYLSEYLEWSSGGVFDYATIRTDLSKIMGDFVTAPKSYVWVQVNVPAVPTIKGTPNSYAIDQQAGWNSTGRSVRSVRARDGYAEFTVAPQAVGVVVGINNGFNDVVPSDIHYGFYARSGALDIWERGQVVHSVPSPGLSSLPRLRIERRGTTVRYYVADALVYTSAQPSTGYLYADASMYVAGDYVDSPQLGALLSAQASGTVGVRSYIDVRPRAAGTVGTGGRTVARSGSDVSAKGAGTAGTRGSALAWLQKAGVAQGTAGVGGSALAAENVGQLTYGAYGVAGGDTIVSWGTVSYGAYRTEAVGGFPEILSAGGSVVAPLFAMSAIGLTGEIGSAAVVSPRFAVKGSEDPYGEGAVSYGAYRVQGSSPKFSDTYMQHWHVLVLEDTYTPFGDLQATFLSAVEVGDTVEVSIELAQGAEWLDAILLNTAASLLQPQTTAEFYSNLALSTASIGAGADAYQIAVNLSSMAPSHYQGFDFLSLFTTDYGSFALRSDGLHRVTYVTEPISARVDFGASELGASTPKNLDAVFFGLRTDGSPIAVLRDANGDERAYRVIARQDYMRATPAQGVSSRRWRLLLELTDVTDAELEALEVVVSTSGRRWTR